ncbi:hypothetical protein DFH06DRAFT_1126580 [Mycena polygramma]|nr:hypothetical protein DFH06DRAFT_1126580 [Mycena polygramma]
MPKATGTRARAFRRRSRSTPYRPDRRWYEGMGITILEEAPSQPGDTWGSSGTSSSAFTSDWAAAGWGAPWGNGDGGDVAPSPSAEGVLARRTLRSGKEFSALDLALGTLVIEPAGFFNVEQCFDCSSDIDEPAEILNAPPFWINTAPTPLAVPSPTCSSSPTPQGATLKKNSKKRRRLKREAAGDAVKGAARQHRKVALQSAIRLDVDAADLSHSKPAWIGMRSAEMEDETGMGGRVYTREEIKELTGSSELRYVNWLGRLSIPIIDSQGRIIAVLGGTPRDVEGWKAVTDAAAAALAVRVTDDGGGQMEPGELCNNVANTKLTDALLREECFQRLAGFANCLFQTFAPVLFAFYQVQMALIAEWRPRLRWNFARSVFAACTFNFGPHAITVPHLDFGNLAWGWCAITALGDFDPDVGGHLILWNLKLVIRFPPGSTILIPSAIIRHSNVPVRAHERRFSFTQYTAGGLFRWIRNGFRSDEDFKAHATTAERAEREAEARTRWESGVAMFDTVATE